MKTKHVLGFFTLMLLAWLVLFVGCGDDDDDPSTGSGQADDDNDDNDLDDDDDGVFALTSTAIEPGGTFPEKYTCDNSDYDHGVSPPLSWANPPAGTAYFAITMFDPDAADTPHWGVFDIPADESAFADGLRPDSPLPGDAWEAVAYTGAAEYAGPCPPVDDDPHDYVITIYALSDAMPDFTDTPNLEDMLALIAEREIDSASLMAKYGR